MNWHAYMRSGRVGQSVRDQRLPRDGRIASIPISAVVSTRNEARNIADCIESLRDFTEVIVFDSNSEDDTPNIVKSLGVLLVNFTWNGSYPKKKQYFLDNVPALNDWILFVDGDERPSPELIDELATLFAEQRDESAFDVPIKYFWRRNQLRHGHRVLKRALVHRARVTFPEVPDLLFHGMGELEGHYQPHVSGAVGRLRGTIEHDDNDGLSSWWARHNRYSDWEAAIRAAPDARAMVRSSKSRQGAIFDRLPGKPFAFFIYSYIIRRGFLDGRAGFEYAWSLATYYLQIEMKTREALKDGADRE